MLALRFWCNTISNKYSFIDFRDAIDRLCARTHTHILTANSFADTSRPFRSNRRCTKQICIFWFELKTVENVRTQMANAMVEQNCDHDTHATLCETRALRTVSCAKCDSCEIVKKYKRMQCHHRSVRQFHWLFQTTIIIYLYRCMRWAWGNRNRMDEWGGRQKTWMK